MPAPQPNQEPTGTGPDQVPDGPEVTTYDAQDEQEVESFPASDPHSDWAGPSN
jgi:hypothetical protein